MSVARSKRFLEQWTADRAFRAAYDADPAGTLVAHGYTEDPAAMQLLHDPSAVVAWVDAPLPALVVAYRAFIAKKMAYREEVREKSTPGNPHFRAWRSRQMTRAGWELGPTRHAGIVHPPVCFELSRGCTVGCWFCGISAAAFQGNFLRTPENAALFRGVLRVLSEVCGTGIEQGFCYWATDPLDNPDYESFLEDFYDILGRWPQTTTAQPLRDPDRTRRLLLSARAHDGAVDRFSLTSRGAFEGVHRAFTAEELESVELLCQFNNDASPKAIAGDVRALALSRQTANQHSPVRGPVDDGGTIACVSGFLFNMVDRSVQLISPCNACAEWPLGYIVFRTFSFSDAEDLRSKLVSTIAEAMPPSVHASAPVQICPRLDLEVLDRGFAIRSRYYALRFEAFKGGRHFGELLRSGGRSAGEIAAARHRRHRVPPVETFHDLTTLLKSGVLAEEPIAASP